MDCQGKKQINYFEAIVSQFFFHFDIGRASGDFGGGHQLIAHQQSGRIAQCTVGGKDNGTNIILSVHHQSGGGGEPYIHAVCSASERPDSRVRGASCKIRQPIEAHPQSATKVGQQVGFSSGVSGRGIQPPKSWPGRRPGQLC